MGYGQSSGRLLWGVLRLRCQHHDVDAVLLGNSFATNCRIFGEQARYANGTLAWVEHPASAPAFGCFLIFPLSEKICASVETKEQLSNLQGFKKLCAKSAPASSYSNDVETGCLCGMQRIDCILAQV